MLTLTPGASCDVCAEEYSPHHLPHSIPCGHILCATCCTNIAEKAPLSRLAVACPFCREPFTPDAVRLIRTDFSSSAWSTPRPKPIVPVVEANIPELSSDLWTRRSDKMAFSDDKIRVEARRLEDRVAKVAQQKSSVEEVSNLHKDLEVWLNAAAKAGDHTSSLFLSAALLRAILMNHVAHSEATKHHKNAEHALKCKIDDMQLNIEKVETELRKLRGQHTQKVQECQELRTELSRFKGASSTHGLTASLSEGRSTPVPPYSTSASAVAAAQQSPLSRLSASHGRSASLQQNTLRSATPGPPIPRSHTPIARPQTSASMRPAVPPMPPMPVSPSHLRAYTPGPQVPPKPRRLSTPSPPSITRSISEEKRAVHERWIPPTDRETFESQYKSYSPTTPSKMSRTPSVSYTSHSAVASRLRDHRSPSPS